MGLGWGKHPITSALTWAASKANSAWGTSIPKSYTSNRARPILPSKSGSIKDLALRSEGSFSSSLKGIRTSLKFVVNHKIVGIPMYAKDEVKVAAVQISVECGKVDTNIRKILERIDEAADNNAELIVLLECSHNGYVFESLDHAHELATPVPGPITDQISEKTKDRCVYVAIGLAEKAKYPVIYNSAILINANGLIIGKYRKNFLNSVDKIMFSNWAS